MYVLSLCEQGQFGSLWNQGECTLSQAAIGLLTKDSMSEAAEEQGIGSHITVVVAAHTS